MSLLPLALQRVAQPAAFLSQRVVRPVVAMVAILFLVLGKPTLDSFAPAWLDHPLGHELPVDETPI